MEYIQHMNFLLKKLFISVLHYLSYPSKYFLKNFLGNLRMIVSAEELSFLPNFFCKVLNMFSCALMLFFFQNSSQYCGFTVYWDGLFKNSVYKNNHFYDRLNWLPLAVNCEYGYLLIACCFLLSWAIHRSDQQTDTFL